MYFEEWLPGALALPCDEVLVNVLARNGIGIRIRPGREPADRRTSCHAREEPSLGLLGLFRSRDAADSDPDPAPAPHHSAAQGDAITCLRRAAYPPHIAEISRQNLFAARIDALQAARNPTSEPGPLNGNSGRRDLPR